MLVTNPFFLMFIRPCKIFRYPWYTNLFVSKVLMHNTENSTRRNVLSIVLSSSAMPMILSRLSCNIASTRSIYSCPQLKLMADQAAQFILHICPIYERITPNPHLFSINYAVSTHLTSSRMTAGFFYFGCKNRMTLRISTFGQVARRLAIFITVILEDVSPCCALSVVKSTTSVCNRSKL